MTTASTITIATPTSTTTTCTTTTITTTTTTTTTTITTTNQPSFAEFFQVLTTVWDLQSRFLQTTFLLPTSNIKALQKVS